MGTWGVISFIGLVLLAFGVIVAVVAHAADSRAAAMVAGMLLGGGFVSAIGGAVMYFLIV